MTPAEAAAFRAGLEAGARVADSSIVDSEGRGVWVQYGMIEAATKIAAAIRALPVPEAVEVTDAEVERALKAWREKRLEPEYAADFVDMLAALRAARGQP